MPQPKPALLTVDDDPGVTRAFQRDLRRHYGDRYQVVAADSGERALDLLDELALRAQPVALMLVDQRMPGMSGVDFLKEAAALYPEAKRALLTAYADTDVSSRRLTVVRCRPVVRPSSMMEADAPGLRLSAARMSSPLTSD